MFFTGRTMKAAALVAFSLGVVTAAPSAFAAGECANVPVKKRMACIEAKVDKLGGLPAKVDGIPAAINNALTGVKVEWKDHPGVCLFFNDWTTKPERTAFSVLGCNNGNYVFNIHK